MQEIAEALQASERIGVGMLQFRTVGSVGQTRAFWREALEENDDGQPLQTHITVCWN